MAFAFAISKFTRTEDGGVIVQLDDGMEYGWATVADMQQQIDLVEQQYRDDRLPLVLGLLAYWRARDGTFANFNNIRNKEVFVDTASAGVFGVR